MAQVKIHPHPVMLERVFFPEYSVKRSRTSKPPLCFPDLEIEGIKILPPDGDKDNNIAYLKIDIKTKSKQKNSAVNLKIICIAGYVCLDRDRKDEIFNGFFSRESPYIIVWPYIRKFVSELIISSGLPEYHIPLAISWEIEDSKATGSTHSKKTA